MRKLGLALGGGSPALSMISVRRLGQALAGGSVGDAIDLLLRDLAGDEIVGDAEQVVEEVFGVESEVEVEGVFEEEFVVVEVAEEALEVWLDDGEVHVGGEDEEVVEVGELEEGARDEGVVGEAVLGVELGPVLDEGVDEVEGLEALVELEDLLGFLALGRVLLNFLALSRVRLHFLPLDRVPARVYVVLQLRLVVAVERHAPLQQRVHDHPQRPEVVRYLLFTRLLVTLYRWPYEVWRPYLLCRVLLILVVFCNILHEAQVPNFDSCLVIF